MNDVERAKAINAMQGACSEIESLSQQLQEARAEIKRLREALEDVKEDPYLAELWIDGVRAALQESTDA